MSSFPRFSIFFRFLPDFPSLPAPFRVSILGTFVRICQPTIIGYHILVLLSRAKCRYQARGVGRRGLKLTGRTWRRGMGRSQAPKGGVCASRPVPEPGHYLEWLNRPQPKEEVENIRYAIRRSRPYGSEAWVTKAVAQIGLQNTIRNPGRPENRT